jgi:hypothetical protein
MMGHFWSRAASSEATTVEDDVTFFGHQIVSICDQSTNFPFIWTHNRRDGEILLLGVFKETEDVIADDDTGLA